MIVNKLSTQQTITDQSLPGVMYNLNADLNSLFTCLKGRVSFGSGSTGNGGENVDGQWLQITTNSSANTETTFNHTLGSIPIGYIPIWQSVAGSLYQGPTTGTPWTTSTISLKCSGTSVTFLLFLLQ